MIVPALLVAAAALPAGAQTTPNPPASSTPAAPQPADAGLMFTVTVVGTTPLPGTEQEAGRVPGPVQIATAAAIESSGAIDIADFLNRRMNGVHVNEIQSNPFQPDINYRGYTASPLLGTPQGLSVYIDGVRLNQPFGEIVSWDLIPRLAVATTVLMPGSNPIFGLNTLGGALSLQTKDGRSHPGTMLQTTWGSNDRRMLELGHGGQTGRGRLHWYLAASLFDEEGWRADSPSTVRQVFGKVGWSRETSDVMVSVGHADNSLTGNGLQDDRLLERDRRSVYTKPDITDNQSTLINATVRRRVTARVSLLANGYYRDIGTRTLNGDINDEALHDEPATSSNGLINRTGTEQWSAGASGQVTRRDIVGQRENLFTGGVAFDRGGVAFAQSTELGDLNPDRSVAGLGVFDDEGVNLHGAVTTWSLYATDTLPVGSRTYLTLAGRYNRTIVDNRDVINPGGGPGSLDGRHVFGRFNPAAGVTVDLPRAVSLYAGYSEGSRAATSIELGCADPEAPCRLPNAMAGDPPLQQVVTRTVEGGIRRGAGRVAWHAGLFRAQNRDDILFVMSDQSGFGYFRNFGATRRQGIELSAQGRFGRITLGTGYTFLRATFESGETVNGESNSANDAAETGARGLEGSIEVAPGDHLPLIPRHLFKAFADIAIGGRAGIDLDLVAIGGSYVRGNENNEHAADGAIYLGEGAIDGYAVVNLGARYGLTRWLRVVGQVSNLFDRRYATAGQLGPAGFTADGRFAARPLPAIGGQFPVRHTTFVAPGAPRRAWIGARVRF
jgi:outer membrane receptor protein involved in Fe transport